MILNISIFLYIMDIFQVHKQKEYFNNMLSVTEEKENNIIWNLFAECYIIFVIVCF